MIWNKKNPQEGSYICRMNNGYIKMCHYTGIEWLDMWQSNLKGTVKEWTKIIYDKIKR